MERKDKLRWLEIAAVVLTGLGKFIFMDLLDLRLLYIVTACLTWMAYVIYRYRKQEGILAYWGWTTKNFGRTVLELLPVALLFAICFIIIGNQLETNILNWNILPILVVYPIWGIIQQFIIVGLIARNLQDLKEQNLSELSIVIITATVFAIVHFPFLWLVIATFLLAIVYTLLYLRGRNLIVLGILHGWMGALFFYTILARDPWVEVFEVIF